MSDRNITVSNKPVRPFLKWAGNKYRILERIQKRLPPGKRLVEPFVGSGAVFLNTHYDRYLLTDTNADLINLYNLIKQEGSDFIRYCRRLFTGHHNQPDVYYERRAEFNTTKNIRRKAALFIYLNRHGYNGLCRYNAKGKFNVPFGRYKQPYFPEAELNYFHQRAQHAIFKVASYEKTIASARHGDVIYCDPPYVPLSASANFTTYSTGGFSLDHQQQLAELAQQTADRGIPVLISNHNTAFTRDAYMKAEPDYFQVQRFISCNGNKRETAGEVLALFA